MTVPALSVIVPVLNEEACIGDTLAQVSAFLDSRALDWELIVVDDGSTDETVGRVEQWTAREPRIRLVRGPHRGKGAAIRSGMAAAAGQWRMMADADLSVAPADWTAFLQAAAAPDAADLIIGSREASGARRIGEPMARHLIGRVFNQLVQGLAVPGVNDTQCGFKMIRDTAARTLFPHVTIEGFAFDVELLFLARRSGFAIQEVGVTWVCRRDSRVRLARGATAFLDIARIRLRAIVGAYAAVPGPSSSAVGKRARS